MPATGRQQSSRSSIRPLCASSYRGPARRSAAGGELRHRRGRPYQPGHPCARASAPDPHRRHPRAVAGRGRPRLSGPHPRHRHPLRRSLNVRRLIVHDGEFGQFVCRPAGPAKVGRVGRAAARRPGRDRRPHRPRRIRAERRAREVRKLGRGRCRRPRRIAFSAMLTGRHDCDYVELVGVVQRAWLSSDPQSHAMFADVAIEDGVVRAAFWDYDRGGPTRFIDARVQLRGNVGTIFGRPSSCAACHSSPDNRATSPCSSRRPIRSRCRRDRSAASTTIRPPAR